MFASMCVLWSVCLCACVCVKWRLLLIYKLTAITVHPTICTDVITRPSWYHTTYIYTVHTVYTREMEDIYYASANISVLAERYRCPQGSVTSHSPSLFYKKMARIWTPRSSTHLHILIIWFSSGCYCVPFYKSGYKIQTFIPAVPWARFRLLRILINPLEPIACAFSSRSSF